MKHNPLDEYDAHIKSQIELSRFMRDVIKLNQI